MIMIIVFGVQWWGNLMVSKLILLRENVKVEEEMNSIKESIDW